MRPAPTILAVMLLLAACGSGETPASPSATGSPSASPRDSGSPSSTASPSPDPTTSPSPTQEPVVLPPGVPASYGRDVAPEDLPHGELVPTGAEVDDAVEVDDDAVALTWVLGDDPFRSEHGLAVWRRSPGGSPPWRATFAIREPPRAGVLGILMTWTVQDLTGDGLADILFLESLGGSGTCGTWGVVQLTPDRDEQTFRRQLCDGTVDPLLRRPGLSIQESVFGPDDPHCCPSGQRTSTLEWNGARWRVTAVEEVAT